MATPAGCSIEAVLAYRDRLRAAIQPMSLPETWTQETLLHLSKVMGEVLRCAYLPIYDSLEPYLGSRLTPNQLHDFCWTLAGNRRELVYGRSVGVTRRYSDWCPVQVLSMDRELRYNKRGHMVVLKVVSGVACPWSFSQFWTTQRSYLYARRMGFTSRRRKYPMREPTELVGMRLDAFLTPKGQVEWDVTKFFAREDTTSSALKKHNIELLRMRRRVDRGYICPHEFPSSHFCHVCHVGQEHCAAAVHASTYDFGPCETCGLAEAPFEPDRVGQGPCVNCARKAAWTA